MGYQLIVKDEENLEEVFQYQFGFNALRSIFIDELQFMLSEMFDKIRDYEETKAEDEKDED